MTTQVSNDYRFKDKGHVHELLVEGEWKKLTGITTILSVISKPALIQWAANMAVDYIKDKLDWGFQKDAAILPLPEQTLNEARKAHCRKKEEAGQKGTDVHAEIEICIKEAIEYNRGELRDINTESEQIKHFYRWARDNKVKFLESELHLFSRKHFLGGICDFVCEINGDKFVGDIKTGSGIYPEHFAQTSAYQMMMKEMGLYPELKGHIILNLRRDGSFEEKRSISNEDFQRFFLAALDIYRVQEKINGQIL